MILPLPHNGQSRILGRRVTQIWEPPVLMPNGQWQSGPWMQDGFLDWLDHPTESDRYPWRQKEQAARTIIDGFTRPGGPVLEPHPGPGTTARAGLRPPG